MKRITIITGILFVFLSSFTIRALRDDFLKQLGITRTTADEKIGQGILDGSVDTYGLKNVKKILLVNRTAVTKEILAYTKQYLQSATFKKEYAALKEKHKPTAYMPDSPEEAKRKNIEGIKKSISETTASMQKSNASMKPMFEKILADGNKRLKEAEDPKNPVYVRYEKSYPQWVKEAEERNRKDLQQWESKYPADHLQYVKRRLQEFLDVTADVDFSATLVNRNGKQLFENQQYERKDYRWKMAFRAGKEVVEPARAFAQQWVDEIK
jgi:hypothetical protein